MGSVKVTGTFTAVAGGMFMDNTTLAGDVSMELAPACLMISGFMGTCDRLSFDSTGLYGAVCVDNTTTMGCTCTVALSQMGGLGAVHLEASLGNSVSGTFTTADNKLTTTAADVNTEYSYCVAGSTLTMQLSMPRASTSIFMNFKASRSSLSHSTTCRSSIAAGSIGTRSSNRFWVSTNPPGCWPR